MKHLCVLLLAACLWAGPNVLADNPKNGGDANCDGKNTVSDLTVMVNYLFKGGAAPCEVSPIGAPICGGFVMADASIISGSPNFTCTWNAASSRYEIAISGYTYFYNQFITLVTPCSFKRFVFTNSGSGRLFVYVVDDAGNPAQANFQFITYAPGVLMAAPETTSPEPVNQPDDSDSTAQ